MLLHIVGADMFIFPSEIITGEEGLVISAWASWGSNSWASSFPDTLLWYVSSLAHHTLLAWYCIKDSAIIHPGIVCSNNILGQNNWVRQYPCLPFGKLEPIMLLVLPIIPSRVSQNFHLLFLIYSHAISYYSYSDCLCKILHVI